MTSKSLSSTLRIVPAAAAAFAFAPLARSQLVITNSSPAVITFDQSIGYNDGNANNDVLRVNAAYSNDTLGVVPVDDWTWSPDNTTGELRLSTQAWSLQSASAFGPAVATQTSGNLFVQNNSATGSNALNFVAQRWTSQDLTLRVQNATGAAQSDWTVSFDLWSYGNFSSNDRTNIRLQFSTDNSTWTTSSTNVLADGPDGTTVTALGNRSSSITASVLSGDYLYLRLAYDSTSGGTNWTAGNGALIDNLSIQAGGSPIPEPSSFAALAGIAALGFGATRRRL